MLLFDFVEIRTSQLQSLSGLDYAAEGRTAVSLRMTGLKDPLSAGKTDCPSTARNCLLNAEDCITTVTRLCPVD